MSAKLLIACFSLTLLAIQVLSFPQELIFELSDEDSDGNTINSTITFRGPAASLADHHFAINRSQIRKTCWRGYWNLYTDVNFADWNDKYHSPDLVCSTYAKYYKSFRSGGARDTLTSAISLYDGEFYEGEKEYYTEGPAYGGIAAKSFVFTGPSSWTLFNGSNFDGTSYCLQQRSPGGGAYDWWNLGQFSPLPISQVGSLLKGCFSPAELAQKIQLYKK